MKKTLYLHDFKDYNLAIDGPSLLVSKKNKAPRRIPFHYLDFVYINYKVRIDKDIIKNLIRFQKPAVITNIYKNDSLHLIPVRESGYFNEIPQRIAVKREDKKKEVLMWAKKRNRQLQIIAIKTFDRNLSKALATHNFTMDEYSYYLMQFCKNERKKFFNTRRKFTDLFIGLINAKSIEAEINPELGIINDKKRLGFVYDILSVIDPVMDTLAAKMMICRNSQTLYCNNWPNEKGFKTIIYLFEKGKPIFSKLISLFIDEIKEIIMER